MMPRGVTGNTSDSGSEESWFEPRRGNGGGEQTLAALHFPADCAAALASARAFRSNPGGAADRAALRPPSVRVTKVSRRFEPWSVGWRPTAGFPDYPGMNPTWSRYWTAEPPLYIDTLKYSVCPAVTDSVSASLPLTPWRS